MKFVINANSLLKGQREWWELPNYYKLLVGGKRSGKTYVGALRALRNSRLNSGRPGMYVSPNLPLAKRTIIPTLKQLMRRSGIKFRHYTQGEYGNAFYIENWDGHIWIGSGDTPESLVGSTLSWAAIDEPFLQKKEVFDEMIARVSDKDAVQPEIFLTGTPEELNWGYDVATDNAKKYDMGVVFASTRDNPYLMEGYVDILESAYDEQHRAAYIDGQFVNLKVGRVYKDFNRSMVRERSKPLDHPDSILDLPIECGMDFNVDAMSCEIYRRGPTWIHYFDEIRLKNANTYDMAKALHAKHPGITVYPDASGSARKTSAVASDHAILRGGTTEMPWRFKVIANRSNPPVKDRVNAFNKLMREGNCSFFNVPELISDLERCTWRLGDIDKRDPERTHASDAGGYPIAYNFPVISRKVSYGEAW